MRVGELHAKEEVVCWLFVIWAGRRDVNRETGLRLEMFEMQDTLGVSEVAPTLSRSWVALELTSAVIAMNSAICSTNTLNGNCKCLFGGDVADLSLLKEGKVAWLVVINDEDCATGVDLLQCVTVLKVVQFHLELAVLVPLFVIDDGNFDSLKLLSLAEVNLLFSFGDSIVILLVFGGKVFSAHADLHLFGGLVQDLNVDCAARLGNGVLERLEAEPLVAL